MSRNDDVVEISYTRVVTDSDLAILFEDSEDRFWIPKSVIQDHDEDDKIVSIPAWFAEKEGLV